MSRRSATAALLAGAVVVAVAACGGAETDAGARAGGAGNTGAGVEAGPVAPSMATQRRAALPLAVRIPRLGIDSELVALAVGPGGVLEPPVSADVAGWHATGTVPGEVGPAVIAGHVDSRSGPGVFVALPELRAGDAVEVVRDDGVAVFRVRSVESVGKQEFPTDQVYGPTPVPELWLITCGGEFDRRTSHYRSNVIARAELVTGPAEPNR